jgi:predicted Holliday junction resolvase-like endonuclease
MKTLLIISIIVVAISLFIYLAKHQITLLKLYLRLIYRERKSYNEIQTQLDLNGYYIILNEQRKAYINRIKNIDEILKKIESATEINNKHSQSGNYANEILSNR